jgi:hypothetical protein
MDEALERQTPAAQTKIIACFCLLGLAPLRELWPKLRLWL